MLDDHGVLITRAEREQYRSSLSTIEFFIKALNDSLSRKKKPIDTALQLAMIDMAGTVEPTGQLRHFEQIHALLNKDYDEKLRYAAQFRLSEFCEYMYRNEVPAKHHELIIDHMEMIHNGDIKRLAISAPPGSAKTSYASIRFAGWHLGRRPSDRWVQGAHTMTFAKDRLGKPVRALITEPRYQDVFPDMRLSTSSSAADYFEFAGEKGYYKAVGVGTGIAGYRFEIGAIDDPISSREDAESPTARRKLHEWYDDDFGTRPSNPDAPIYICNTRWHEDDLVGHELQKMAEGRGDHWEIVNIPALAEDNDPLGRAFGEGLWPELFGTKFYMEKKRTLTGRSWNSLYQGNPTDVEGGVLKREDVKEYANIPEDVIRGGKLIKKVVRRVTLSIDCAEKATQRSDFTAATVWLESMDKKHYLIHADRVRKEFVEMVEWIEEIAKTFHVDQILVEDRGAGTQYIQLRSKKSGPAPVKGIATKQQSKEFRFDGVTPMFSTGVALLPKSGVTWLADVEAELFAFPNGRHDDYVDTVSQYLADARERSGSKRGVRKNRSSTHA